jgi:hypothetical protein
MGLPIVKFPGEDFILPELQKDYVNIYIAHKSEKKSRSSTSNLYN